METIDSNKVANINNSELRHFVVRFAELTFTPVRIRYMWEEKGASSSSAN